MANCKNKKLDLFDSETWDPNLPSLSPPDKSPEHVAIKPQAVAYTTVGSLVNPRATLPLSAPNRIQREGAHRKSLLSMIQGYDAGSPSSQSRASATPLSMANSMQYAQQISRNSIPATNNPRPVINRPTHSNIPDVSAMSDDELKVLLYALGKKIVSENEPPLTSIMKEMTEDEFQARSGNISGPVQGLEKMQTLQRLSRFPNPMQKLAQTRLSQLSVTKSQSFNKNIMGMESSSRGAGNIKVTSSKPLSRLGDVAFETVMRNMETSRDSAFYDHAYITGQIDKGSSIESRFQSHGELDRGYQFPHPGFVDLTAGQANPLYGAYSANTQLNSLSTRPPGYPQPLTAGPPGQREYPAPGSFASTAGGVDDFWSSKFSVDAYNPLLNGAVFNPPNIPNHSPWTRDFIDAGQAHPSQNYSSQPKIFSKTGFDHTAVTKVVDTISPQDALKYYPNGLPSDMIGDWSPPSEECLRIFGEMPPIMADEKENKRNVDLEDKQKYGYRRLVSMKFSDYEAEYQCRQANPHGPIAPPAKVAFPPITIVEMEKLSVADVAAPFVEAALGNLLAYKDKMPGSRFCLSKWREAEQELIDTSEGGNKSFFSEDWGTLSLHSSTTSRFQPTHSACAADGKLSANPTS
jgi:hypothetical protein